MMYTPNAFDVVKSLRALQAQDQLHTMKKLKMHAMQHVEVESEKLKGGYASWVKHNGQHLRNAKRVRILGITS